MLLVELEVDVDELGEKATLRIMDYSYWYFLEKNIWGYKSMIWVVLGFHLCVSRRSLQLTLALVCLCWLGCFLLFSVGELIFDLFLTSSNTLTATVESNAATEKKKTPTT